MGVHGVLEHAEGPSLAVFHPHGVARCHDEDDPTHQQAVKRGGHRELSSGHELISDWPKLDELCCD